MKVRWPGIWLLLPVVSCMKADDIVQNAESQHIETSTTSPKPPSYDKCFHTSQTNCPREKDVCSCRLLENETAVVCCNIPSSFHLKEGLACLCGVGQCNFLQVYNVTHLHIYNATLEEFNIQLEQPHLKPLKSVSVTDGRIGRIVGNFAKHSEISCLNFSNNGLIDIDNRSFVFLTKLRTVDLSHNNLSIVPNFIKQNKISLDISDNHPLMCKSLVEVMNTTKLHFLRGNETFCLLPKTFNWFNTTDQIPLNQVETYRELEKKTCSDNCTCKAQRLDLLPDKPPTFAVKVDCSGKQMTEMPTNLPPNTIALNISNNNITELKIDKDIYENIRELDADNNQIKSILSLEGTKFIDNFVALSLRNNQLDSLPNYVLSNIFDRNSITRNVHLGFNKLNCNCTTAKILKAWLLSKTKNIPDYQDIFCRNLVETRVIDLDQAKLCQHTDQQEWTDYIYYIISAEVLLLVCLILKVSYDYWIFKTAGYLPWPASKMPKLPCDWLCE